MSVLITLMIPALLVAAGLAVDGARLVAAQRQAQAIASQAARTGVEASSGLALHASETDYTAISAAMAVIDGQPQYRGEATMIGTDKLTVKVYTSIPTTFLNLIGVHELNVEVEASSTLWREEP